QFPVQQTVTKILHDWGCQPRESIMPQQRHDVEPDILLVGAQCPRFAALTAAFLEPALSRFFDRDARRFGGMDPIADFRQDRDEPGISFAPAHKGLDMPLAVLIAVIDNPSDFFLARARGPDAFAYRPGHQLASVATRCIARAWLSQVSASRRRAKVLICRLPC